MAGIEFLSGTLWEEVFYERFVVAVDKSGKVRKLDIAMKGRHLLALRPFHE